MSKGIPKRATAQSPQREVAPVPVARLSLPAREGTVAPGADVADACAPGQARQSDRTPRPTPALLKDLRTLKIAVYHPDDADGAQLVQQLQRIGSRVETSWPPPALLPSGTELVFLAVHPEVIGLDFAWCSGENRPALIAVVAYENPTIVEAVLRLGAKAVLPAPVRSFGLLSALVLARQLNGQICSQARRLAKLELKLAGQRALQEAIRILAENRGIGDDAAYDLIRQQAMAKRVTREDIAAAIIQAHDVLNF